jgi:hypothetical protein
MAIYYLDASAVVKYYMPEPGSFWIRQFLLPLTDAAVQGMSKSAHSTREGTIMHVTIELPDEFAQRLQTKWQDTLAHYVRERLVMEAYRDDLLSTREVQELLGLDDRFAVYDLCKKYDIVLYTLDDLERDRETTRQLGL